MKKSVVSALAVAALAGAAFGQAGSNVILELRIVPQSGVPSGTVAPFGVVTDLTLGTHTPITSLADATRRFEVQYRIRVPTGGTGYTPAGLTSGNLRITCNDTGNGHLERALLSRFESTQAGSVPPASPDATGVATNAFATATGLHKPFRGGIPTPTPNNDNPANGAFSADAKTITGITPLSLSQSDQNAPGGTDGLGAYYGLFSFNFVAGNAEGASHTVMFSASFDADASPPNNKFGFFDDGNPVPITSPNATGATAGVLVNIPSPGAMALLGLGGLVAGRRRRA